GKARRDQSGVAAAHARARSRAGEMAETGRPRLLQLPRSADQRPRTRGVPAPCDRPLAKGAAAPQPEGSDHLGTDDAARRHLAPETAYPPSLAERSLCRHTPEVGAVCGKAARTVVCPAKAGMFSRRKACRGKNQRPVVWIAGWRETKTLKPIDNVSRGEATSP